MRGMSRRRLLLSTPLLLAVPLVPGLIRPALAQAAALSARDQADLRRVEAYFNAMTTLKARFLQVAWNGASAEGTAWIWRPGRMRFDYDPPEPLLLVASHGQFMQFDRELGQPTVVPTSATPLAFLLRADLRLSGDVTVTRVERSGGFLRVTLYSSRSPAEGTLTLVLAEQPMELRQWVVVDAQRHETRVTLSQIETGSRFDPSIFEFNDPQFMEKEQMRRR